MKINKSHKYIYSCLMMRHGNFCWTRFASMLPCIKEAKKMEIVTNLSKNLFSICNIDNICVYDTSYIS